MVATVTRRRREVVFHKWQLVGGVKRWHVVVEVEAKVGLTEALVAEGDVDVF